MMHHKTTLLITLIFSLLLPAGGFAAEKSDRRVYSVDSSSSIVRWVGYKVLGLHDGSMKVKAGSVETRDGQMTGGSITIDMTSMTNADLKDDALKEKLVTHLQSDDFFSVEKFPTSTFKVTQIVRKGKDPKVQPAEYELTGDLTIKGITRSMTAPVRWITNGSQQEIQATLNVDRTLFGIRYGSGQFFQNLGDKLIKDVFTVDLKLFLK